MAMPRPESARIEGWRDGRYASLEGGRILALPHSGWPTVLKLARWVCGGNPLTLERERALTKIDRDRAGMREAGAPGGRLRHSATSCSAHSLNARARFDAKTGACSAAAPRGACRGVLTVIKGVLAVSNVVLTGWGRAALSAPPLVWLLPPAKNASSRLRVGGGVALRGQAGNSTCPFPLGAMPAEGALPGVPGGGA